MFRGLLDTTLALRSQCLMHCTRSARETRRCARSRTRLAIGGPPVALRQRSRISALRPPPRCLPGLPSRNHSRGRQSLFRYHRVIETEPSQAFMALNARIPERGIFVAPEGEDGLVHLLSVEYLQAHEQVEVLNG